MSKSLSGKERSLKKKEIDAKKNFYQKAKRSKKVLHDRGLDAMDSSFRASEKLSEKG